MNTSGRLLLASVLAVVLMAPPAYSQTKEQVNDMLRDLIDIKGAVGALQRNADAKNTEMKGLLEQILGRFTAIDASVQKLESSLSTIKTNGETSARDLTEMKTAFNRFKETFDRLNIGETLGELKVQVGGLNKQVTALQTTEAPLPSAGEAFNAAWLESNQGLYDLAIPDFRDFLSTYPKDPRAALAQLSIGNAYASQGKHEQAVIEFDLTIDKYPNPGTKCTALYKKGQSLVELKQTAPARAAFEQVVKECANTPEHPLAQQALRATPARGQRGN
jgi:TolA-binding protein